ncbi:hypothetical protein EDD16DRAFT_1522562 [Pisolithus croceorrhizus]|nr:hypothetical protein EDD16DRAFT_1522562 [Pisolithus croceorrhizus]KAI6147581.1 hypothetical protein EDD17DRAFT_1514456 [Pisolithus thermaeus]
MPAVRGLYAFTRIPGAENAWNLLTAVPPPTTSKISTVSQTWVVKSSWFACGRVVDAELPDTTISVTSFVTIDSFIARTWLGAAKDQRSDTTLQSVIASVAAVGVNQFGVPTRPVAYRVIAYEPHANQASANRHRTKTMKEGGTGQMDGLEKERVRTARSTTLESLQNTRERVLTTTLDVIPDPLLSERIVDTGSPLIHPSSKKGGEVLLMLRRNSPFRDTSGKMGILLSS